ncbi:Protein kinase [Gracilaria domingensis]|nr:Protein kinase [Gracilaria domingensis]
MGLFFLILQVKQCLETSAAGSEPPNEEFGNVLAYPADGLARQLLGRLPGVRRRHFTSGPSNNTSFSGETIDFRFLIGAAVGAGASATVFRARDNENEEEELVVKFALTPEGGEDSENGSSAQEEAEDDLANEAQILTELINRAPHLRIPKIFGKGQHENIQYLILTRFGDSVQDLHENAELQFTNAEIITIVAQVFETMCGLHALNMTHGDIKESNVARGLGENKSKFYLIDFGQAKSISGNPANDVGDLLGMMGSTNGTS